MAMESILTIHNSDMKENIVLVKNRAKAKLLTLEMNCVMMVNFQMVYPME